MTLAFFALSSHALGDDVAYGRVSMLWAITFMVTSVIYRPIEQLLASSIAESRAHGRQANLRTPVFLQAGSVAAFLVVALLARSPLQESVFGGDAGLYWVLICAVATYSLSYFVRGWLAGTGRPELYGALVLAEASVRCVFPIVALIGLTEGSLSVALGIAAAPLVSLAIVPLALRSGVGAATAPPLDDEPQARDSASAVVDRTPSREPSELGLKAGSVFASSTVVVMLSEQLLLNAAVFAVAVSGRDSALTAVAGIGAAGAAGAIFNAFLVSRAPLQLFQAVQSTLLPHLAGLAASGDPRAAAKALRGTIVVIAAFASAVSLGLLVCGPWALEVAFDSRWDYSRISLTLIGVGMGLHLAAGTLTQSALAHRRAPLAAGAWAGAAALFVAWLAAGSVRDPVLFAGIGYALAAAALVVALVCIEIRTLWPTLVTDHSGLTRVRRNADYAGGRRAIPRAA